MWLVDAKICAFKGVGRHWTVGSPQVMGGKMYSRENPRPYRSCPREHDGTFKLTMSLDTFGNLRAVGVLVPLQEWHCTSFMILLMGLGSESLWCRHSFSSEVLQMELKVDSAYVAWQLLIPPVKTSLIPVLHGCNLWATPLSRNHWRTSGYHVEADHSSWILRRVLQAISAGGYH